MTINRFLNVFFSSCFASDDRKPRENSYFSDSLRVERQTSKEFSLNSSHQTREVTKTRNGK